MLETQKPPSQSYQIYALIDPRDDTVCYVGMSVDAQMRFYRHLTGNGVNLRERRWIKGLRAEGLSPILRLLETIVSQVDAYSIACERALLAGCHSTCQPCISQMRHARQTQEVKLFGQSTQLD